MRFTTMEIMRSQLWLLMIGIGIASVYAEQLFKKPDDISDNLLHKNRGKGPLMRYGESRTETITPPTVLTSSLFDPNPSSPRPQLFTNRQPEVPVSPPWCVGPQRHTIKLNFSNMSMGRFDEVVVSNADVISLNLSHNFIKHIPANSFVHLPMLRILDLSANKIPVEELLQFKNLLRLELLFLDDNDGTQGRGYLGKTDGARLLNLKNLHLRGNHIRDFTVPLKEFSPHLTHLYLSRNEISSSEFVMELPQTLTHLNLDDNSISRIESDNLGNLRELSINRNDLEVLCVYDCNEYSLELEPMKRLKNLHLSGNKINRIVLGDPSSSYKSHPPDLFILDLSHNELTEIPNNVLHEWRTLRHLVLGYNKLTEMPNMCALSSLQHLDLSDNSIKTVPARQLCEIALQELNLSNNKITVIQSHAFGRVLSLDLSGNQLSALLYSWIVRPDALVNLRLQNNNITDLRSIDLTGMSNLQELYITRNPLTHLVVNSVNSLSPNLRVYFHDENDCASAIVISDDNDSSD